MDPTLATDEAGNIWEVDAQGRPVRLVQAAGGAPSSPTQRLVKRADPTKAAMDQMRMEAMVRDAARDRTKDVRGELPTGYRWAADGKTAEPIPGTKKADDGKKQDPAQLESIRAEALDKIRLARSLQERSRDGWFATGFGANIAGSIGGTGAYDVRQDTETLKNAGALTRIMEMAQQNGGKNPLTPLSNSDFQALASSLSNLDTSQSDSQFQNNVQRVIDLYSRAYKGAGGTDLDRDLAPPAEQKRDQVDRSTRFYVNAADNGGNSGSDMSIATGATRREPDPVLKGVNARINGMLKKGASDEQIRAYIEQVGARPDPRRLEEVLQFRRKNPAYNGNYSVDLESREVSQSGARQLFQKVGSGPVGSFATSAADSLLAGRLDDLVGATGGNAEQADAAKALLAKSNPTSSLLGNVAGGALAAGTMELGLARAGGALPGLVGRTARAPLAADVGYGAAIGSDDPNNRALGALIGGLTGGAGGYAGNQGVRLVRGVQNQSVRALADRGIPLTFGQAVGQSGRIGAAVKSIEDRMSGLPVLGSMLNERRRAGIEQFNRAAFDDALAPIGGTTGGVVREQGIEAAQRQIGDAYDSTLAGVQVRADQPFVNEMGQVVQAGRGLPDPMGARADYTLRTRVGNSFGPNGEMGGREFQQSVRGLRRDASSVADEPYGHDFGDVTRGAEGALEGMLNRQAPGVIPAYQQVNQAFRLQEVLREAVKRSRNGARTGEPGLFAPSTLADAATQNATRFGNSAGTTRQPFYDLTQAGQRVLPNAVPDSGTAGRLLLAGGLTGGGYAGGAAAGDAKGGLALGAALAALQTQAAQRALVASVLNRPRQVREAADWALRNGVGTALGTPFALQALPTQ